MSEVEEIASVGSSDDSSAVDEAAESRSLMDVVEELIEDGKTNLEAELNFQ